MQVKKMLNYLTHFLPTKLAWYSTATFWLGLTSDKKVKPLFSAEKA